MIKEAAAEEYTPIFANKGAGTSPDAQAKFEAFPNGTQVAPHASAAPLTWTPEAQQRLDRVPAGFMRDCTRALIHKHAEKIGATTITLDVANAGIDQARGTMEEAMKSGNVKEVIERLIGAGAQQGGK